MEDCPKWGTLPKRIWILPIRESLLPKRDRILPERRRILPKRKFLEYLRVHPQATRLEVSKALGDITEDGVKYAIARLQEKGLLERVGGRKQGEWIVKDKND